MATVTSKKLYRGAASTTTTTTLYTVPSATTTVVTNIVVTNTAASAATFTIALAGYHTNYLQNIDGYSTVFIDLKQVINATETIQGGASSTTVNIQISGVEIV